jgi:hypothetical protein
MGDILNLQGDQQENKLRMLPYLLFYGNVCLSLIVHISILAIHSRFIGCLSFEKFMINLSSMVKPILLRCDQE